MDNISVISAGMEGGRRAPDALRALKIVEVWNEDMAVEVEWSSAREAAVEKALKKKRVKMSSRNVTAIVNITLLWDYLRASITDTNVSLENSSQGLVFGFRCGEVL
jgi:hypothetical protein